VRIYFDPSVLIALYLPEPLSPAARTLVEEYAQPIPLNELQELEVKNGLRQKVLRGEITEAELARALRVFDDDVVQKKLQTKKVAWRLIYRKAQDISRRLSVKQVCRSFDLLHVAVSVVSNVKRFATFDVDQSKLALSAGLNPIEFSGR
jgi:predicted nucleic acid-binding protein